MGKKWSLKYKNSINCNKPKGFSQKQFCKYKKGGKKTLKKNSYIIPIIQNLLMSISIKTQKILFT